MNCPFCQQNQTRVVDSRLMPCQVKVKRRRACDHCKARFSTYEVPQIDWPKVLKRDGRKEAFNEEKLKSGFLLACEKLEISSEVISAHLAKLKKNIISLGTKEIESNKIGDFVMTQLRLLDPVAYIRFAAVYKRCHDLVEIDGLIRTLHQGDHNE